MAANVWTGPGYAYYEGETPVSYVPLESEPGAVGLTLYYDQPAKWTPEPIARPGVLVLWGVGVVALYFLMNRAF